MTNALVQISRELNRLRADVDNIRSKLVVAPLNAGKAKQLTIAAGVVEATRPFIQLYPETSNVDDLDTIDNGSDGKMVVLSLGDATDIITITTNGNIDLGSQTSLILGDVHAAYLFIYRESTLHWELMAAGDVATDFLDLDDTPASYTGEGTNLVAVKADESGLEFVSPASVGAVTSVNGQTGVVVLDADDIAETATNIWFTPAEESKLAGIEALADVTDAVNIASSIVGVASKATPIDADTLPLIDSAAGNALKELSWADLKATLKAYNDGLYVDLLTNQNVAGIKTFTDLLRINGSVIYGIAADASGRMYFQAQNSINPGQFWFLSKDSDGTDNVSVEVWAKGTPAATANRERLIVGYDAANLLFNLNSEASGTGTVRPLMFKTGANTNQLYLLTNGRVTVGSSAGDQLFNVIEDGSAAIDVLSYRTDAAGGGVYIRHARGTESSPTTLVANDMMGQLIFYGYDGTDWNNVAAMRARYVGADDSKIEFIIRDAGANIDPAVTIDDTGIVVVDDATVQGNVITSVVRRDVETGKLTLIGGTSQTQGPYIDLFGKDVGGADDGNIHYVSTTESSAAGEHEWFKYDGATFTLLQRITAAGILVTHNIIRAMSSSGIRLEDDAGNLGLSIDDGADAIAIGDVANAVVTVGGGSGSASLYLDGAAGNVRDFAFFSNGSSRWIFRVNSTAESGSNAGSDWSVMSRTDAGGILEDVLFLKRSSGFMGIKTSSPVAALHVDANATAYDATTGLAIFQDNSDRQIAIGGLGLFRRDSDNDAGDLRINYIGYNGGTTRFRDLTIYNGKNTGILTVDGSAGAAYIGVASGGASKLGVQPGSSANDAAVGGVLYTFLTSTVNLGTGEDDLIDRGGVGGYSVPANTLAITGQSLWFEARGEFASNLNTKRIRVRFGTTGTNLFFDYAYTNSGGNWVLKGRIFRTGSTTQRAYAEFYAGSGTQEIDLNNNLNQTLSGAVLFKITGEATADSDITLHSFIIGWDDNNT